MEEDEMTFIQCGKAPVSETHTIEERDALIAMFAQYNKLKKMGWNDARYCPKNRTEFLAIEAGSTGVHRCYYEGEWPNGSYWILEAGDMWPSHPILFKPLPKP